MKTISQRELRNRSGEIMRQLEAGATFVVTRHGVPVGELVPLRRTRFVARADAQRMFSDAPGVDAVRFRDDLAVVTDQTIEPRA